MTSELIRRARELRQRQTKAESLLWNALRAKRLCNVKFRRQHPIPPFVADFACCDLMLIIEIDGGYHDYNYENDVYRQRFLESKGWRVVRTASEDVVNDVEAATIAVAKEMGLELTVRPRIKVRSGMRCNSRLPKEKPR